MQLHERINMLGAQLQQRYGEKIYKLSLDGGFTCPNRDGLMGRSGCTFCNVASFVDESIKQLTITQQLQQQAQRVSKAKRFLAYFQAYTSTYAEVDLLKQQYEEALQQRDVIGLCVGTRPDCVTSEVLDLLLEYQLKGYYVWLELGLQTTNNATLKRINRGHDVACYRATVKQARIRGLKVCTHLIIGLPQENIHDNMNTLREILEIGVDGLKLHPLHVVEGSVMATMWRNNKLRPLELSEYVTIAGELIRHTPPEIIFHRISANARRPTLLAPLWCENHWLSMNHIDHYLRQHGPQGSALGQIYQPLHPY